MLLPLISCMFCFKLIFSEGFWSCLLDVLGGHCVAIMPDSIRIS